MGQADYYAEGDWNAHCFECGRKFKASELKKTWQEYWACPRCWKPRHPQDFVRGVPNTQAPAWTQSLPDVWVEVCTLEGISCICDFAVADCAICDYLPPGFEITAEMRMIITDLGEIILTDLGKGIFP